MVVAVVKTTEEEGVAIAAEVISWLGWLSMDTKTNLPLSVYPHMLDSTSDTSVAFWNLEVLIMTTLQSTSGDWDYVQTLMN